MSSFHRRVEIVTRELGPGRIEARCAMQDDFHHFRLAMQAKEGRVAALDPHPVRHPNVLCPAAGERLLALTGIPLNEAAAAVSEAVDPRQQCTHQLDLAGLGLAAMARRRPRRVYEAAIPDRVDGRTAGVLWRDGVEALRWEMEGETILGPEPYAGRSIGSGFTGFARSLPYDEGEAALVLRRAVFVSQGRDYSVRDPGVTGPVGGCWAWQPERVEIARQQAAPRIEWAGRAADMAAMDADWLSFE